MGAARTEVRPTATLISPEEFLALADQEEMILEYDDGVVSERPDMTAEHEEVQLRIGGEVMNWSDATRADVLATANAAFWLSQTVLKKPDVAILRRETLAAMSRYRGGVQGCPTIAVEVISGSETTAAIDKKTRQYLEAGAEAVWNVYRESQTVLVWRRSGDAYMVTRSGFLEEPGLFPGLRIAVAALFPVNVERAG